MRRWHAKEKGGEGGRGRGEGLAVGVLEAMEVVADELAAGGAEVDEVAAGSHGGDAAAPVARWPWIWGRTPLGRILQAPSLVHGGRIWAWGGGSRRSRERAESERKKRRLPSILCSTSGGCEGRRNLRRDARERGKGIGGWPRVCWRIYTSTDRFESLDRRWTVGISWAQMENRPR